ncbi:hypothetical protein DEO72_LG4g147 [Vigna unguiculata]|uniref:Uncharacterized protein n=1 Tax=Vigna unguiculata TaxID=3917 RepID=A0A4D6LKU8_VIGUN|nr:hypothetical protein DEO72_LG4g147 [Vigna unguiculata]
MPWYVCVDLWVWLLQGNSDVKRVFSPKRAYLAQARLAETGQIHTRALAQAKSSHLSEETSRSGLKGSPKRACVGTLARRYNFQPRRGVTSLRRGGARLGENSRYINPHCWWSRLGEGQSLERKNPFA